MTPDALQFNVSNLTARVPDGVTLQWHGREFASGPCDGMNEGA